MKFYLIRIVVVLTGFVATLIVMEQGSSLVIYFAGTTVLLGGTFIIEWLHKWGKKLMSKRS